MNLLRALALIATFTLVACSGGGSSSPASDPVATDPTDTTDPVVTVDEDGNTQFDSTALGQQLVALALGELSDA